MTKGVNKSIPLLVTAAIVLISGFGFFYNYRHVPTGFFNDAITDIINGICVGQNGRDEYGVFMPAYLRAFEDYRPPIMIYIFAIASRFIELNVYSARLITIACGFLPILVMTYALWRLKSLPKARLWIVYPLFLTFFLFSSWVLLPHRIPMEFTVAVMFVTGLVLSTWWLISSNLQSIPAAIVNGFFHASVLYAYEGTKALWFFQFPIMAVLLFVKLKVPFKSLFNKNKAVMIALLVSLLFSAPMIKDFVGPRVTLSRFRAVGSKNPLPVAGRFLQHVDPKFLFFKGDANLRHSTGYKGALNFALFPLYILGIFGVFFQIFYRKSLFWTCIGMYFVVGFLPVSLTHEGLPHSIRTLPAIPAMMLICFFGYKLLEDFVFNKLKVNTTVKMLLMFCFFAWGIYEAGYNLYYYHTESMKKDHLYWTFYPDTFEVPKEKQPYGMHDPYSVNERYYRMVTEKDYRYCDSLRDKL